MILNPCRKDIKLVINHYTFFFQKSRYFFLEETASYVHPQLRFGEATSPPCLKYSVSIFETQFTRTQ